MLGKHIKEGELYLYLAEYILNYCLVLLNRVWMYETAWIGGA